MLDMMAATPIANAAGNKIALVLAAFKDFVTLRPISCKLYVPRMNFHATKYLSLYM